MQFINSGKIIIFGSGETSPVGAEILRKVFSSEQKKQIISILETPAGFQPNSETVAQDIAEFYNNSLKEFIHNIHIIPARAKHTFYSPDNEEILQPIKKSTFIFLGPGSPTYAVRQLRQSFALQNLSDQWQSGATIAFSSAAAMAIGKHTLPVYEIYKAGQDLFWIEGLNFLEFLGISLTVIAHWNNTDGGDKNDTTYCYMGKERFKRLKKLLPQTEHILGIDENTAIVIDVKTHSCTVLGRGNVTYTYKDEILILEKNKYYSLKSLKKGILEVGTEFLTPQKIKKHRELLQDIPSEIQLLIEKRQAAKISKDFETADSIREELAQKGYIIEDTSTGVEVFLS